MRGAERTRSFEEFVATRRLHLRRVAYALCGDWDRAEDLLQIALEKAYVAWPRIRRAGAEEAFVRTTLVRVSIDESRRPWRRERSTDEVPEREDISRAAPDDRSELFTALQSLPEMQRKVVVLRYWLDLSVTQAAGELGISEGTVKSHAARGLAALRTTIGDESSNPTASGRTF